MNKEEYIEDLLDVIYKKYRIGIFNLGEIPNLVTLSPEMCDAFTSYFNLERFDTIFGMKIIISSEVTSFNMIGVYRIERADRWKNTI